MASTELTTQKSKEQQEPDHGSQSASTVCQNCKTPLTGPFCHQCGQPDKSIIRFFGSLVRELLEDIAGLDSRAFRTLFALIFKPGFLTNEYLAGRRFFYVPPLRLFLITSIICIFTIWLINKTSDTKDDDAFTIQTSAEITPDKKQDILKSISKKPLDQLNEQERIEAREKLDAVNKGLAYANPESVIEIPEELLTEQERLDRNAQRSAQALAKQDEVFDAQGPPDEAAKGFADGFQDAPNDDKPMTCDNHNGFQVQDDQVLSCISFLSDEDNAILSEKFTDTIQDLQDPDERRDFFGDLLEIVPKVMLLLVPIFAIFVKLMYPFAKRYYIEHLIHAFHGHAFLFLAILFAITFELIDFHFSSSDNFFLSSIGNLSGLLEIITLWYIPLYFIISTRRVYKQNWFFTLFKTLVLAILYFILFTFSAIIVLILSVLLG